MLREIDRPSVESLRQRNQPLPGIVINQLSDKNCLEALSNSRPRVGQNFRDTLRCQSRDIGRRSFDGRIGAKPFDAIPQQMKVIELFATDPLQLLDGSAAVGGVDRLGILNQRLIQTRAGTFKCEAFGEFVDKNCGLSPLRLQRRFCHAFHGGWRRHRTYDLSLPDIFCSEIGRRNSSRRAKPGLFGSIQSFPCLRSVPSRWRSYSYPVPCFLF